MRAKEIYKEHLELILPNGYQSEKQMTLYREEAAINAIQEILDLKSSSEKEE